MLRELKGAREIRAEIVRLLGEKPWYTETVFIPRRRVQLSDDGCNWELAFVFVTHGLLKASIEQAAQEVQARWNLDHQ